MSELLPCPWCGTTAGLCVLSSLNCVKCDRCGCEGPPVDGDGKDEATRQQIEHTWNRRVQSSDNLKAKAINEAEAANLQSAVDGATASDQSRRSSAERIQCLEIQMRMVLADLQFLRAARDLDKAWQELDSF